MKKRPPFIPTWPARPARPAWVETLFGMLVFAPLLAGPGPVGDLEGSGAQGAGAQGTGAQGLGGVDEDARLEDLVERRLAWDRELAPYDLEVGVTGAVVNLGGSVSTPAESHRARGIAEGTAGVLGVVNGIVVDPALARFAGEMPRQPDDATLRERIRALLEGNREVAVEDMEISVDQGYVVLSGQVGQVSQKVRAARIVLSLHGVQGLENEIRAVSEP